MGGFAVSRGAVADLPEVMPVMRAAFDVRYGEAWTEAQLLGAVALPGTTLLIARATEVVGFALSRTVVDSCELLLIAVRPDAQGRGVGRALLDQVIADAALRGAATIFLEMRESNPASTLYSTMGFTKVGHRRDYYRGPSGEIFDALTFRRDVR